MTTELDLPRRILSDVTTHMKYAKYLPEIVRRETWHETVDRNKAMHLERYPLLVTDIEIAYQYVYDRKVLPSMRSMQFAGKAIATNPVRLYNCSFLHIDHHVAFSEIMFLLLSGTGVGYSVQRRHVRKLKPIHRWVRKKRFLVGDSIEGWADAVRALMRAYFDGKPLPVFDFRDIRPKGARLVTSGGKAPGPDPLKLCLASLQGVLDRKTDGERLTPLEVHDLCCYIADAVLAGGIRRAAMIALFDMDDEDMLDAKSNYAMQAWQHTLVAGPPTEQGEPTHVQAVHVSNGKRYYDLRVDAWLPGWDLVQHRAIYWVAEEHLDQLKAEGTLPWYYFEPQRGRANNTAVIVRHKVSEADFQALWARIEASGSGEPGFMFTNDPDWGLNPCAEVSLRSFQFCNLSTIVVSDVEDQEELNNRAWAAALIGTLQAGYTDFHYLRDEWRETTEREALIGVSMTGVATEAFLALDEAQAAVVVTRTNEEIAARIGIKKAARCTVLKPEGTTSCVVGSSSGNHAWHAPYFLRSLRVNKNEPIYPYLLINAPELLEDDYFAPDKTAVIRIPIKAPDGAITRHNETAIDLLNRTSRLYNRWIKPGHRKGSNYNNVSTTVSIKDHEWGPVGAWMWAHRDEYTALSVLPFDGGSYIQPPFSDIDKSEYERRVAALHDLDMTQIVELDDHTAAQQELACSGGACEVR